ncbi:ribosome assembly RNA-binding protein YhbY, partial [Klebsiella pneumoniae]|nr:ribosome assembly RNA-binding protein YhbY [Klebsiella pneumoniae]
ETKALIVEAILRETVACNVQVIGKTLFLYRPTPERKISLPR